MRRILLPTDFSKAAHKAIRYAIDFFGHDEVHYTLFHVHDFSSLENESLERCEEKLKAEVDLFNESSHDAILTIETAFGSGNIVQGIQEYAREHEMDVIVMGTKSHSRPKWMGSNTEEILLHSKCPVFAIPNNSAYHMPKKVVVLLDPDAVPDARHMTRALQLLHRVTPEFYFFSHVDKNQTPPLPLSYAELLNGKYTYEYHVSESGDIAESIIEFNGQVNPDLLILFPHRRQLFKHLLQKSISKEIAHFTNIPLLSLLVEK